MHQRFQVLIDHLYKRRPHGRCGIVVIRRTTLTPHILHRIRIQKMQHLRTHDRPPDLVTPQAHFLPKALLRQYACTVDQNYLLDRKGQPFSGIHLKKYPAAERMHHNTDLRRPERCHKPHHKIHIVIHAPRFRRLRRLPKPRHIQRDHPVMPCQNTDHTCIQGNVGPPPVQQQNDIAFPFIYIIYRYRINLLNQVFLQTSRILWTVTAGNRNGPPRSIYFYLVYALRRPAATYA